MGIPKANKNVVLVTIFLEHKLLDEKLSLENKERLKKLHLCYELYISGRLVRMFHANPHNAWDSILSIDRLDKLYDQFLPTENTSDNTADIVLYAHTHAQACLLYTSPSPRD
mgnify:CR=1 FL=1